MRLTDVIDPLLELLQDTKSAEEVLERQPSQFARRAFVRSAFAYFEGAVWLLKQACLLVDPEAAKAHLSNAEYALLNDETYELKANGEPVAQTKFIRFQENLKFANAMVNRLFGSDVDLGVGGQRWEGLLNSVKVRNRIAHPKNTGDYQVSDAELEQCRSTTHWFNSVVQRHIDAMIAAAHHASA